jgi:large subunit ribosomal protein L1
MVMAQKGKRYRKVEALVDKAKLYSIDEGIRLLGKTVSAKFDETVELAVGLGVDPRKADQNVRGSVALPHGLGKTVRVAVFARGAKAAEAEAAGADIVGAEDLVQRVQEGFQDFDSVIATPDMMVQVGKIGKILGPRGLMPSPKIGTVTFDVGETVKAVKAGRADYKVDKTGIVHVPVGKGSFKAEQLQENLMAVLNAVIKAKPSTSKGVYVKNASISLTMGPGVRLDVAPLRAV